MMSQTKDTTHDTEVAELRDIFVTSGKMNPDGFDTLMNILRDIMGGIPGGTAARLRLNLETNRGAYVEFLSIIADTNEIMLGKNTPPSIQEAMIEDALNHLPADPSEDDEVDALIRKGLEEYRG